MAAKQGKPRAYGLSTDPKAERINRKANNIFFHSRFMAEGWVYQPNEKKKDCKRYRVWEAAARFVSRKDVG